MSMSGFQYCISTKLAYMLGCFFSEELNTLLFKSLPKFILYKHVDLIIIIPNRDIISTQFISFTPPPFSVKY